MVTFVGKELRSKICSFLRYRRKHKGEFRITFPFPKGDVMQILGNFVEGTKTGRMTRYVVQSPDQFDSLCGKLWDVFVFQGDRRFTCIHTLRILTSENSGSFLVTFTFSLVNQVHKDEYRTLTSTFFRPYFEK